MVGVVGHHRLDPRVGAETPAYRRGPPPAQVRGRFLGCPGGLTVADPVYPNHPDRHRRSFPARSRTRTSQPNPATITPPAPTATACPAPGSSTRSISRRPDRSQIRTVPSRPAVTAIGLLSSTVHATASTMSVWPVRGSPIEVPVVRSQIRTVPSRPAVTAIGLLSSTVHATAVTRPVSGAR